MAFAQCKVIPLAYPLEQTAELQPELGWDRAAAPSPYRVQLQVRSPEGGNLWSVDTLVNEAAYRPPRALTRTTASVKALITSGCERLTQEDLEATSAAFFVDVTRHCPVPEKAAFDPVSKKVSWSTLPEYRRMEMFAYSMKDGRLIEKQAAVAGSALVLQTREDVVLALRPSCQEVDGQVYLLPAAAVLGGGETAPR